MTNKQTSYMGQVIMIRIFHNQVAVYIENYTCIFFAKSGMLLASNTNVSLYKLQHLDMQQIFYTQETDWCLQS